jgi:cobaltochelatase CobT
LGELTSHSACLGITTVGRKEYGGTVNQEAIDMLPDNIREHAKVWTDLARECNNTQDVIDLAKSVYKLIQDNAESSDPEPKPEDFDPQSGKDMDDGEPSEGKGEEGKGEEGEGTPSFSGEAPDSLEDLIEGEVPSKGGDFGEGTGPYRIFTDKYDLVYSKKDPQGNKAFTVGDPSNYEKLVSKTRSNVAVMKTKLRRALLAKQQRDWDFGKQAGRLDTKRLVSGYQGNQSVYKTRTDRMEEDTAVTFLVDLSGSMHGRRVEVAQMCAIAFAQCLEGTQISYSIQGFDVDCIPVDASGGSWARKDANIMYRFKEFDEPLRKAKACLGNMHNTGMRNNADRDALVYAINDLRSRPEKRKVLIVLSDGSPAHSSDYTRQELIRHAKVAIEDGAKVGVQSVGIGIQDNCVTKIYKDNVVVNDINELSGTMFNKLSKLLVG